MTKKIQNLNLKPIPPHSPLCNPSENRRNTQQHRPWHCLWTPPSHSGVTRYIWILCQFTLKNIHEYHLWKRWHSSPQGELTQLTTGRADRVHMQHSFLQSLVYWQICCNERKLHFNRKKQQRYSQTTPKTVGNLSKKVLKSKARLTGRYWTTVPFCFPTASCFPLGLQQTG